MTTTSQRRYWTGQCHQPHGGCTSFHTEADPRVLRSFSHRPPICTCFPDIASVESCARREGWSRSPQARAVADDVERLAPRAATALLDRDEFTRRVFRYAMRQGIRQVLELGSGHLATHAAHKTLTNEPHDPDLRIVYVDHDCFVNAENGDELEDCEPRISDRSTVVRGNAFAVGEMLSVLAQRGLLDLTQKMLVLLVDLLPYLDPAFSPRTVIQRLVSRLEPGTLIAANHLSDEPVVASATARARERLRNDTAAWCQLLRQTSPPHPHPRSRNDFEEAFTDLDVLPPGFTTTSCWPEPDNTRSPRAPFSLAAVGRVPGGRTRSVTAAPTHPNRFHR